jgi:hypothetical protein
MLRYEPAFPQRSSISMVQGLVEASSLDHIGDVYSCPAGKMLTTIGSRVNGGDIILPPGKNDCQACGLMPRCCPKEPVEAMAQTT